jgi:hypothetical protein
MTTMTKLKCFDLLKGGAVCGRGGGGGGGSGSVATWAGEVGKVPPGGQTSARVANVLPATVTSVLPEKTIASLM